MSLFVSPPQGLSLPRKRTVADSWRKVLANCYFLADPGVAGASVGTSCFPFAFHLNLQRSQDHSDCRLQLPTLNLWTLSASIVGSTQLCKKMPPTVLPENGNPL